MKNAESRGEEWNRGLFQRLSGFETGHPATVGLLCAFWFQCFRRARSCFSPSPLWSVLTAIHRVWILQTQVEALLVYRSTWEWKGAKWTRRKPNLLNSITSTDTVTLLAHRMLAYTHSSLPWVPLDLDFFTSFACAATSYFPPAFDSECPHRYHLAHMSQLNAFSPRLSQLQRYTHSMQGRAHGDLRAKRKYTDGTASSFKKATGSVAFLDAIMGDMRVRRVWGTSRKVSLPGGSSHCHQRHRTVLLVTRKFAPLSRRRATNQRFLSSLDSGKLWLASEELGLCSFEKRGTQQRDRWLAFQNWKRRWKIKRETHAHTYTHSLRRCPYLVPAQALERSSIWRLALFQF